MGSVKKRGPSWQATYRGPDRKERTKTFPKKVDAENWLADEKSKMAHGIWVDPQAGRITLSAWGRRWLAERTDLRPVTQAKYQHMLDNHILPVLGSHDIAKLSPSAVRSWYMGLRRRFRSTGDDAYRLLHAVLATAVTDGLIGRNPCQVRGAGQARSAERLTLSVAEVSAAVEATPERYRLAVLLAAWCQLRRGEVLALQRRDVDLLHGTLRIERAAVRPMNGVTVIGPPKTEAGVRTLTIPDNVIPALQHHLERFVAPGPQAWLFAGENGAPVTPVTLNRIWRQARAAIARPEIVYHDLRHSGLTWAAASGASIAELMKRGGHANPRAALRYQHATEDRDRAIAEALAALALGSVTALRGAESLADISRTCASSGEAAPGAAGALSC